MSNYGSLPANNKQSYGPHIVGICNVRGEPRLEERFRTSCERKDLALSLNTGCSSLITGKETSLEISRTSTLLQAEMEDLIVKKDLQNGKWKNVGHLPWFRLWSLCWCYKGLKKTVQILTLFFTQLHRHVSDVAHHTAKPQVRKQIGSHHRTIADCLASWEIWQS